MQIDKEKKNLRNFIKEKKKTFSLSEKKQKSLAILNKLEQDEDFKCARTLMMYWSIDDEVYTHDFIVKWSKYKKIILPSVNGEDLVLKEFVSLKQMITGEQFGIPEPEGQLFTKPENIEVIVVPGIAFDKDNNRMGRGKAFYDKLLKTLYTRKIGICFDFQLFEEIPTDKYDIKMDKIISG